MTRKSKPSRKSAIRSNKAKNTAARKPAKSAKSAGGRLAQPAKKPSKKSAAGRTTGQSLDKTVDRCVATLDGLRKQCVAKVRRLVRAGRSYLRSNSRIRSARKR